MRNCRQRRLEQRKLEAGFSALIPAQGSYRGTRRLLCGIHTHWLFYFSCEMKLSPVIFYHTPLGYTRRFCLMSTNKSRSLLPASNECLAKERRYPLCNRTRCRLKINPRHYLANILPGLANKSIRTCTTSLLTPGPHIRFSLRNVACSAFNYPQVGNLVASIC